MSDAHELFIEERTGAARTKGSGNQFNGQTDNRHRGYDVPLASAYDGKATIGKSIGVTKVMWQKLVEQAAGLIPVLPLRFYRDEYLREVEHDLVVISFEHYMELRELAKKGMEAENA